jgi:hypothetical protein
LLPALPLALALALPLQRALDKLWAAAMTPCLAKHEQSMTRRQAIEAAR